MTALDSSSYTLVDTPASVRSLLAEIKDVPTLYVDLEGVALSRYGSISLVTLYAQPRDHTYIVDVHTLREAAFSTAAPGGATLRSVLESPAVTKVFFDVRNDSDALHHHYGVCLQGVEDIQLMEIAGRRSKGRSFVSGLNRCLTVDAPMSTAARKAWSATKEAGMALFNPPHGGTYEAFNARPLHPILLRYCVNDVCFLPLLRDLYWGRLDAAWRRKVADETRKRVVASQSATYEPHSEMKKFGPWNS